MFDQLPVRDKRMLLLGSCTSFLTKMLNWPDRVVVKSIAIGAEGCGFDSPATQIALSLATLRRFFGVVLPRR